MTVSCLKSRTKPDVCGFMYLETSRLNKLQWRRFLEIQTSTVSPGGSLKIEELGNNGDLDKFHADPEHA